MYTVDYFERTLASLRLSARSLSTLPGFSHHTYALVDEQNAEPGINLDAPAVPLLGLAAAPRRNVALHELTETALDIRWSQGGIRRSHFGLGQDEDTASDRAIARAWECVARGLLGTATQVRRPDAPHEQFTDAIPHINGRLVTTLYETLFPVPLALTVLHLPQPPHYLAAVGCGVNAEERATMAVFCKLDAYRLPRSREVAWTEIATHSVVQELSTSQPDLKHADTSIRTFSRGETFIAEAHIEADIELCQESVLNRADYGEVNVHAPVEFALSYSPENVRISRIFHENSKLRKRYKSFPIFETEKVEAPIGSALSNATRDYRLTGVELPLSAEPMRSKFLVEEVQKRRRSWAVLSHNPITLQELSHVLKVSYGITGSGVIGTHRFRVPLRATPSGGGLYSNDIYVLAANVSDLRPGLYYFNPDLHLLQLVNAEVGIEDVASLTGYPERVRSASVLLLLAGSFRRNQWKYWERGYRTVLLDCGHLAQSLIVTAGSLGLVAHPIGGFIDDSVNEIVGLDGVDDAILHLVLIGHGEK